MQAPEQPQGNSSNSAPILSPQTPSILSLSIKTDQPADVAIRRELHAQTGVTIITQQPAIVALTENSDRITITVEKRITSDGDNAIRGTLADLQTKPSDEGFRFSDANPTKESKKHSNWPPLAKVAEWSLVFLNLWLHLEHAAQQMQANGYFT